MGADTTLETGPSRAEKAGARGKTAMAGELCDGARTGRYRIAGILGRGAMGIVYRAYDPELARCVALKVPRGDHGAETGGARNIDHSGSTPTERARFLQEARGMALLSHPNVVQVFAVERFSDAAGLVDGACAIAMEIVEGVPLNEWLDTPRAWHEVIEVFAAAGRGLAAAHDAGLVHRDFKPGNVVLGHDGRVRVMDFGLVTDFDSAQARPLPTLDCDSSVTLTRTGTTVGTPAYMAPEQHLGDPSDPRSDQFAFCVSLFEALFRRRPFRGNNCQVLSANKQMGRHRRLPLEHGVPPWVVDAVLRGMSPLPRDRFASMRALLAALRPRARRQPVSRMLATGFAMAVAGLGLGSVIPVPQSGVAAAASAASRAGESSAESSRAAASSLPFSGSAWRRM